jgi:threonine/homoserine/homoserine lactone efflux protein
MISLSFIQLWLYAIAIFVLFLTPGPVWIAIMARSMATGTKSAWPLAAGVALGDFIWPIVAIGGIGILAQFHSAIMPMLAFIAVIIFIIMGIMLIWKANKTPEHLGRLTGSGFAAGFMAGFLVIISNPKAILFI